MKQKATIGRIWRVIARRMALVLTVVVILILTATWLSFIEVRALDFLYSLRPSRPPSPSIEIVDIGDDPSAYQRLRDPHDLPGSGCEIPRRAYTEAVHLLSRWGAKAIVFDVMFRRSCKYEDKQLADAFRQAGNVLVAASTKTKPGAVGLQDPVKPLDKAVWAVGSPVAHQPNGTVRSIPLVVSDRDTGREYLALSVLAFECFKGKRPTEAKLVGNRWLETAGLRLPILPGERISLLNASNADDACEPDDGASAVQVVRGCNAHLIPGLKTWSTLLINWIGEQGSMRPHLLSDLLAMNDEEGRALFAGKAVMIGQEDWDVQWTSVGAMPGLEIQANALQTLLDGRFVRPLPPLGMLALLAAFSLATTMVVRRFRGVRVVGAVALLMGLVIIVAWQFLVQWGVWIYSFYCELAILLTWGAMTVAETDKVTALLTRFIPAFIGKPETTGAARVRSMEAAVFFSDIRGYTGTAEQLSALDTMNILNAYHNAVEDVIVKYGGTIVKTPGDAILVVFWKNARGLNYGACALQAAKEILHDLPALGQAWEALGVKLDIGIGITAGQIAMGLIGKRHLEPTVIGDPVNVSQRLESLTKTLKRPVIFSESLRELLSENTETVFIDEVTVHGRKTPLRIYTIPEFENPEMKSAAISGRELR